MKNENLSIPALAENSGVSRATISNILNGKADPSNSTLEKLASSLKVSMSMLYAEKPILKSLRYRTHKDLSAREKSAKETLLYTIYDKLNQYKQIEKYSNLPPLIDVFAFPREPESAAHRLRRKLSIAPNMPVFGFCEKLNSLGIKLFFFCFGLSKTFGLSVNKEDGGPAIFVNTGTANVERWIFTIFHELGHIILHPESYDGQIIAENEHAKEETDADLFAAEFLLPTEVVKEKVKGTRDFSFIRKVLEIKQEYSVSYKCVLRQYCRAYSREYNKILPKFQAMYKQWKKHDFKGYYEPEALPKDRFSFEDPNFKTCLLRALGKDDVEWELAAKLLETDVESLKATFEEAKPFAKDAARYPF
ncbi:MAG: ImmA/IrrE family metallo-endopeptidase [Fibrobacteraceae bacterium]|nr:ImmA/IrrE family metallo-endopeptidase [Fibrobacteraceae bacterium]